MDKTPIHQKAEAVHGIVLAINGPGPVPLSKLKKAVRLVCGIDSVMSVNAVLQAMDDRGMITWDKTNKGPKEKQVAIHDSGTKQPSKDWVARLQATLPGLRF